MAMKRKIVVQFPSVSHPLQNDMVFVPLSDVETTRYTSGAKKRRTMFLISFFLYLEGRSTLSAASPTTAPILLLRSSDHHTHCLRLLQFNDAESTAATCRPVHKHQRFAQG